MNERMGWLLALVAVLACRGVWATPWSTQDYDLYPADFNGDGVADLLYIAKAPGDLSGIALAVNGGFDSSFQTWPSNYLGISWSGNQYNAFILQNRNGVNNRASLLMQAKSAGAVSFLLKADADGRLTAISQSLGSTGGLTWSADQHRIIAGDFTGDGLADVFLQAASASGISGIIAADGNAQFTASSAAQQWNNSFLGFRWAATEAIVYSGDFNADGALDLLIQARPRWIIVDYEVLFPVPSYPPNMNGIAFGHGYALGFPQGGLFSTVAVPSAPLGYYAWSRNAFGVEWSPLFTNLVVGNFNGNGGTDILLQALRTGKTSYLVGANGSGSIFANGTTLDSNINWSADSTRLLAGNFAGSATGVYFQALNSGGANAYSTNVSGGSVATTAHDPSAPPPGTLPTTAGRIAASFSVSESGASHYTIPLWTPPGVGPVQLQLALDYNSRSPNDVMGVGWSLSGLSAIARCNRTWAQDGAPEGLMRTTSDRLCLDGQQLKVVSGSASAPAQGGTTYATELESFSRIVANGSAGSAPSSFTVTTKDGLIYEYGSTTDSRILAGAGGVTRLWALSEIRDRVGNKIKLSYYNDASADAYSNGTYRIKQIDYPYTASGQGPFYQVAFTYTGRQSPEIPSGTIAGYAVQEPNQLTAVTIRHAGGNTIKTYNLGYGVGAATSRLRLSSVQECSASSCFPATMIAYQEGQAGWATQGTALNQTTANPGLVFPVDVNGDGLTDLLFPINGSGGYQWSVKLATGGGGFGPPQYTGATTATTDNVIPGDFAARGRIDLLYPSGGNWWRAYWNGSGFSIATTGFALATSFGSSAGASAADVNGDGKPDLAWTLNNDSRGQIFVAFNTTQPGANVSFAAPSGAAYSLPVNTGPCSDNPHGVSWEFISTHNSPSIRGQMIHSADFDADGREDVWARVLQTTCSGQAYYWRQLLSTGTGFTAGSSVTALFGSLLPVLIDWDGDGCTDVADPGSLTTSTWKIRLTCARNQGVTLIETGIPNSQLVIAADWNSDGRQDLLTKQGNNWLVARSTGPGMLSLVDTGIVAGSGAWFVGDFDGDGLSDLGYSDQAAGNALYVNRHNGAGTYPDLATSFTDGWGMYQSPTYVPISQNNYTRCTDPTANCAPAAYPEQDYQGAFYVVNQFTAADGAGSTYQDQFWYYGARLDVQGRGFKGFYARRMNDSRHVDGQGNRLYTYDYYQQAFPYIGMLTQRLVSTSASVSLGSPSAIISLQTSVPNNQTQLAAGQGVFETRYFPFVHQTTEKRYEFGALSNGLITTRSTQYTYGDGFGNLTNVQTTITDNDQTSPFAGSTWQTTVVNSYLNDNSAAWCVGLPTQSAMTSSAQGRPAETRTYGFTPDANHSLCRIQQRISEPNTAALNVTESLSYDSCGNVSQVDVLGHNSDGTAMETRTTKFNYSYFTSRCQLPEASTNALNQTVTVSYQYDFGVPLKATDANEVAVNYQYDDFGRRVREARPDGTATTVSFKQCTRAPCWGFSDLRFLALQTEFDSNGATYFSRQLFYDGLQRLRFDQSNRVLGTWTVNQARTYDSQGRLTAENAPFQMSPQGQWAYSYDLLGRRTTAQLYRTSVAAGDLDRAYSWGYAGRTVQARDPLMNLKTYVNDVTGRLRRVTDPLPGNGSAQGATTTYDYDNFGNLANITDAIGAVWSALYNVRGFRYRVTDPNAGTWNYDGNSLNEATSWRDAKNQLFQLEYDRLGRVKKRTEPEGISEWVWGTDPAARNIGSLASVTGYGYAEVFTYDTIGRLQAQQITTDQQYRYDYTYNSIGEIDTITYPQSPAPSGTTANRLKIQYGYSYGSPVQISDVTQGTPTTLWSLTGANDYSSPTQETLGANAVSVSSAHTPWTNDLTGVQSGAQGGTNNRQNLSYQWDTAGNLRQRSDAIQGQTEIFSYDALNRPTGSALNGNSNFSVSYTNTNGQDRAGNILSRSDVGTYGYADGNHPHGVTTAGSYTYTYDANGNVATRNGLTLAWASYNLPTSLQATTATGTYSSQFLYGPDRQRYRQTATYSNGTETTHYAGGLFEKISGSQMAGVVAYRHYIPTPSGLTAIITRNSDSTSSTTYVLSDHLGSSDALVDGTAGNIGNLLVRQSFGPFGQRRASNWATGGPTTAEWLAIAKTTRRGFTSHEALDNVGLVHMNGRVYDPIIGRFLSADPLMGDMGDSQSVNAYAYVGNRPLSYVDPTGWQSAELGEVKVVGHAVDVVVDFGVDATRGIWKGLGKAGKALGGLFGGGGGPPPATSVANNSSAQGGIATTPCSPSCPNEALVTARRMIDIRYIDAWAPPPWFPDLGHALTPPNGAWVDFPSTLQAPPEGAGLEDVTVSAPRSQYIYSLEPGLIQVDKELAGYIWGGGELKALMIAGKAIKLGMVGGKVFLKNAAKWTLGGGKSATKWANQMAKRGWSEKQIGEALGTKGIPTRNAVNPGNPATRHIHPGTGQSVVIDNKTNEIIHVGGKNFDYSHWDIQP